MRNLKPSLSHNRYIIEANAPIHLTEFQDNEKVRASLCQTKGCSFTFSYLQVLLPFQPW